MFFKRKPKPEDCLDPEEREIYKEIYNRIDYRVMRQMRNFLFGGAAMEVGVAVAVDFAVTGGAGTAFYLIAGLVSASMAGGGFLIYQDEKAVILREANAIAVEQKRIKMLLPPPLPPQMPKLPLLLKLVGDDGGKIAPKIPDPPVNKPPGLRP